jgi:hypothetical protein
MKVTFARLNFLANEEVGGIFPLVMLTYYELGSEVDSSL